MVYIGIDLGGTNIAVGVVNEAGAILAEASTKTLAQRPYQELVKDMADCALKALEKAGLTVDDVKSIGIGIPGTANQEQGMVIFCTNLGWANIPLRDELQKYINKPVFIDNDANVAALAENFAGVSAGCKSSVLLTLGTGVGGGIILGGKALNGVHGSGGEIGHMVLERNETETCGCGKKGCAEQYCSASGVVKVAHRMLKKSFEPSVLRERQDFTCKDVFDAAAAGDALAQEILEKVYSYMARLIADICAVVNPETVVIGGGVSKAGDVLLEGIDRYFHRFAFHAVRGVKFNLATLGNDAGAYGAFKLALQEG